MSIDPKVALVIPLSGLYYLKAIVALQKAMTEQSEDVALVADHRDRLQLLDKCVCDAIDKLPPFIL